MAYWIFNGSMAQLNIDNDQIVWPIQPRYYANQMNVGDQVFFCCSTNEEENSEYIAALCEIITTPILLKENYTVELRIMEKRMETERDVLCLHDLKLVYGLKNLEIFKIKGQQIYLLLSEEYQRLLQLWNAPSNMTLLIMNSHIDKYLYRFKEQKEKWFENQDTVKENYEFFQRFSKIESLETMEWKHLQEMGDNLFTFRIPLIRSRALGQMRMPIEHYRRSFIWLLFGEGSMVDRLDQFISNKKYKLFGFGPKSISELLAMLFPNYFCFFSEKEIVALEEILKLQPALEREDSFAKRIMNCQKYINESNIVEKYLDIVGKQTQLPILYEISQFLGYVYENNYKNASIEIESEEEEKPQFWIQTVCTKSSDWERFSKDSYIEIGGNDLENLKTYKYKKDVSAALKKEHTLQYLPNSDATIIYQFCHEMKVGDYVFIKRGEREIIALGKIVSDYKIFLTSNHQFSSIRKVEWIAKGLWTVTGIIIFKRPLTFLSPYEDTITYLLDLFADELET